jgi:hypothetical protein
MIHRRIKMCKWSEHVSYRKIDLSSIILQLWSLFLRSFYHKYTTFAIFSIMSSHITWHTLSAFKNVESWNSFLNEPESSSRIQMRIKSFSRKNFDWIAQLLNQTSFDANARRIFFNRIRMFCILLLWSNALHRRVSTDLWTRDVSVMIKSLLARSLLSLR